MIAHAICRFFGWTLTLRCRRTMLFPCFSIAVVFITKEKDPVIAFIYFTIAIFLVEVPGAGLMYVLFLAHTSVEKCSWRLIKHANSYEGQAQQTKTQKVASWPVYTLVALDCFLYFAWEEECACLPENQSCSLYHQWYCL